MNNIKQFTIYSCIVFIATGLLLTSLANTHAQVILPDWDTVKIKTHNLGHGIYMLEGFGGNIGVSAGEDGVILVDDQYAPLTEKILAALDVISKKPVTYVINTHWHDDHTGGNENLGKSGAVIVAHEKTRSYLLDIHAERLKQSQTTPKNIGIPVLTFNDVLTFHFNGQTIHAFHVEPAHTDGDIIIQFVEANVIHTGDTYFNGFYPYIDVDHGGSIDGMIDVYDKLIAISDPETRIIPGHGDIADRNDMREYQTMLKTVRSIVANAIIAGNPIDEFIATEPLKALDPIYGNNLIKAPDLLRMLYKDLLKNGNL
ncbi:MAG: MBL fold metallo-hydrolase [Alphaproteobacteria bacterium]|nr:MAG: MBL fold metallo-hydrolase [Alphaproteobacteria bacterium]